MGKCSKFGSKTCIVNTQNGVRGRCFSTPAECSRNLKQVLCVVRRRKTGGKGSCPLPKP